MQLMNKTMSKY